MGIAAILLAAGPADALPLPPALLPWHGDETLVEFQIRQIRGTGIRDIVVVLGCEAERIIPLVAADNVEPIVDPRWAEGEASWIRVGAAAVPRSTTTALLARIEEPRPASSYRWLIAAQATSGMSISRASAAGRRDTPVIADATLLTELRNLPDGRGTLGALLARNDRVHDAPLDGADGFARISSPADYERALLMFLDIA